MYFFLFDFEGDPSLGWGSVQRGDVGTVTTVRLSRDATVRQSLSCFSIAEAMLP